MVGSFGINRPIASWGFDSTDRAIWYAGVSIWKKKKEAANNASASNHSDNERANTIADQVASASPWNHKP